jgi:hypothetical protein
MKTKKNGRRKTRDSTWESDAALSYISLSAFSSAFLRFKEMRDLCRKSWIRATPAGSVVQKEWRAAKWLDRSHFLFLADWGGGPKGDWISNGAKSPGCLPVFDSILCALKNRSDHWSN